MRFVLPPGKWKTNNLNNYTIVSDGKMTKVYHKNIYSHDIPANRWGKDDWYRMGVKAYYERV